MPYYEARGVVVDAENLETAAQKIAQERYKTDIVSFWYGFENGKRVTFFSARRRRGCGSEPIGEPFTIKTII